MLYRTGSSAKNYSLSETIYLDIRPTHIMKFPNIILKNEHLIVAINLFIIWK